MRKLTTQEAEQRAVQLTQSIDPAIRSAALQVATTVLQAYGQVDEALAAPTIPDGGLQPLIQESPEQVHATGALDNIELDKVSLKPIEDSREQLKQALQSLGDKRNEMYAQLDFSGIACLCQKILQETDYTENIEEIAQKDLLKTSAGDQQILSELPCIAEQDLRKLNPLVKNWKLPRKAIWNDLIGFPYAVRNQIIADTLTLWKKESPRILYCGGGTDIATLVQLVNKEVKKHEQKTGRAHNHQFFHPFCARNG